ncbi:putative bifunctional diguanylate cyclase/phosphodiesterase [Amycolatopsis regifaucium]|uniref:putative bifunctional diguanylate cyclase/phosphodiesterase n=1 Tax=Amycolatopsis regifaucium TaxID=546365 RepID=UPI0008F63CB0|nr:diguanylate cyclase [Amycolatopsis regifaucium]SFH05540.1 PAS domain S-box-containing protein/diguanylate cyclase (GGDEF) domain-containing protein [Amycolatopsis regifaucium]
MPEPGAAPGLVDVARRWAATLADTKGVSLPQEQLEQLLLGVAQDAVRAEPDHRPAVQRFSKLYSASPIGIALADSDGRIVEANDALGQLLGYRPSALRGRNIADLGSADHDIARLRNGLSQLMKSSRPTQQERLLLDHHEEGPLWVDVTLTDLPGDRPGSTYPVLMVSDANEIHLLQERLLHQNVHDPLTGLPNAAAFDNALETALAGSGGEQVALVYLDVDGFKVINDGLGAGVGDQVLRGVAAKLKSVFTGRHNGSVARLSGDGFAVLLRGEFTSPQVIALVEQALEELAEPIYLGGHGIGVSASAGIVVRPVAEGGPKDLLRAAEIALHRAKEAGKAQWMLFDPELDARDRGRYQLGAVIAGALENGEFSLIYQPTVKLANPDQLAAVNAGLRWNHPEKGELDSDEFYPLAQITGMTIPLGRWLLAESLAATARWRSRFGEAAPDVCVRLPNRLAIDPDLVLLVKEQLDRHNLPAQALRLCTDRESVLDPRCGEVLDSFAVLADLGAQLVLTISGSADLELIPQHRLPVRHVILSGAVVDALADREDEADVRHLCQLVARAKELKLRIGAEGVRSHDQAERLRRYGVLAARGPFVADSATGDEVDELIERHAH